MKICNITAVMLFSILILFTSCDLFDFFSDDEEENTIETSMNPSSGEMYDKFCNFSLELESADEVSELWLGQNGIKEVKAVLTEINSNSLEGEFDLSNIGYGQKDILIYDDRGGEINTFEDYFTVTNPYTGYIAAGYSLMNTDDDIQLRIYKPDGTAFSRSDIWDYTRKEYVHDIAVDTHNNIIVAGSSDTGPGIDVNMVIQKFDIHGNLLWEINEKLDSDSVSIARSVVIDSSDNIYIAGETAKNAFLKKYNSAGTEDLNLNIRVYAGNDGTGFQDVELLGDGSFLLTGTYAESNQSTMSKKWLVHVDSSGNVLNNNQYDDEANSYGYFVGVQKDRNRIICAGNEANTDLDLEIHSFSLNDAETASSIYLMEENASGIDLPKDLAVNSTNDEYYMAGMQETNTKGFIYHFSADGSISHTFLIDSSDYADTNNYINSICLTNENNVISASYHNDSTDGNYYRIMQVDSELTIESNFNTIEIDNSGSQYIQLAIMGNTD